MDEGIIIDLPEPPTFDVAHYHEMQMRRGCESYEEGDPDFLTAEEVRDDYFVEALMTAYRIRDYQALVAGAEPKTKKQQGELDKIRDKLKRDERTIGVYLIESENFFGTESAEYLRGQIRRLTGIEFDKVYRAIPTQQAPLF